MLKMSSKTYFSTLPYGVVAKIARGFSRRPKSTPYWIHNINLIHLEEFYNSDENAARALQEEITSVSFLDHREPKHLPILIAKGQGLNYCHHERDDLTDENEFRASNRLFRKLSSTLEGMALTSNFSLSQWDFTNCPRLRSFNLTDEHIAHTNVVLHAIGNQIVDLKLEGKHLRMMTFRSIASYCTKLETLKLVYRYIENEDLRSFLETASNIWSNLKTSLVMLQISGNDFEEFSPEDENDPNPLNVYCREFSEGLFRGIFETLQNLRSLDTNLSFVGLHEWANIQQSTQTLTKLVLDRRLHRPTFAQMQKILEAFNKASIIIMLKTLHTPLLSLIGDRLRGFFTTLPKFPLDHEDIIGCDNLEEVHIFNIKNYDGIRNVFACSMPRLRRLRFSAISDAAMMTLPPSSVRCVEDFECYFTFYHNLSFHRFAQTNPNLKVVEMYIDNPQKSDDPTVEIALDLLEAFSVCEKLSSFSLNYLIPERCRGHTKFFDRSIVEASKSLKNRGTEIFIFNRQY